jgi:hypothetical protein
VGTEPVPVEPEHPLTDLEGPDAAADRLDLSGELVAQILTLGRRSPVKNLQMKGLAARSPQSVRFTVVA